ncbi:MAG: ABC transporter ATP-binding protein [Bauldia sp.]|nr:ABC transporter ATP-binding protein [Bauldia sp.]
MSPLIEVQSLRKHFGSVVAVDDISFAVDRGEVLGFLGPNGAGKSTTMKIITGYLPATDGRAAVCGHDIALQPIEAKRTMGYLPEGAPLYGDMTPTGFLDFIGRARRMPRAERKRRIAEVVERMELGEVLHRRIETLSKGFRRRVGLAQAILHDPDVLILDEPTDGLDPNQKHQVRELIKSMGDRKAIIISTHILEEVDAVCDRAIIIDHGKVVSDGTPAQLHARSPEHNAVMMRVPAGDAARTTQLLMGLPEVDRVEERARAQSSVLLMAVPKNGQFIGDLVAFTLRENNIAAADLHAEAGKLDDVFRKLTTIA